MKQARLIEIRNPHDTGKIRTTCFKYDKNGNQTKTETPKGVATATVNSQHLNINTPAASIRIT
jgi:hypothetical protein